MSSCSGSTGDEELETIREAREREQLYYRTWWDGSADGPISTEWDVWKWPSTFILDGQGVIRFVDRRGDGMIEAVDQLLDENASEGFDRKFADAQPSSLGGSTHGPWRFPRISTKARFCPLSSSSGWPKSAARGGTVVDRKGT